MHPGYRARNTTRTLALILFSLLVLTNYAQLASASQPDWAQYNALLQKHVVKGKVDYTGLQKDPLLQTTVNAIKAFDTKLLADGSERKAFYINLYNLLTLELVADHWPVTSIRKIGGWFRSPWSLTVYQREGKNISLDDIEKKLLYALKDPRIHFAINCASISCPDLHGEAYDASNVDQQLNTQAEQFIRSGKGVQIRNGKLRVSKIFDWYEDEFTGDNAVLKLVHQYRDDGQTFDAIDAYLKYDWDVNAANTAK